jgi:hypothetical protein
MTETLGVPAHDAGLIVERPELTVGIVHAISRPTGLELDLLARRPLDRRDASERQADIRAGRTGPPAARRRLLPPYDEGIDLRVGWLDQSGRAHWEFGSWSSSSGDHFGGTRGPSLRTVLALPPLFDHVPVVFAWPEIGFPETVVDLSLPDRATVERDTVSIWDAPLRVRRPPDPLRHRVGGLDVDEPAIEAGRMVAAPRVLSRDGDAVVVLTRLTAVGAALSVEILSVAGEERARAAVAGDYPPSRPLPSVPDPGYLRTRGPGAAIAVVHDRDAVWVEPHTCSFGGDDRAYRATAEFVLSRPAGDVLTLLVAWPSAGLPDVCVDVPVLGFG